MRSFFPVTVAVVATFSAPFIVQAQVNPTRTITVAPGYGVTIIPAVPVYKIWVDDGSRLGVDFDRPPEEGATIIHVYQSSKQSNTFSSDGGTMLTLVSGDGQLQKIAVNFSNGKIQQNVLDLTQASSTPSTKFAALTPTVQKSRIEVIRRGLDRAIAEGSIRKNSDLENAVEEFLALMAQGKTLESASQQTGVMLEVIGKLAKMGVEAEGYQLDIPDEEQLQVKAGKVQPVVFTLKDFEEPTRKLKRKSAQRIQPDPAIASEPKAAPPAKESPTVDPPSQKAIDPESEPAEDLPAQPKTSPFEQTAIATLPGGMPTAKQIERGYQALVKEGELKPYSQTGRNVQTLIRRVKWGESPTFAAQESNVEPVLVARLIDLGEPGPTFKDPHGQANAIVRGLAVANRTGEIGYYSYLSSQVQTVVRRLRRGASLETALQRSGVTRANVDRLLQLGNYESPVAP
ncbi:hypothetical protein [Lyngbya confervoides]|uniref:Uncharacterized protein n=1 Tax=Lyngbya confervoides BDU141951 TaxID=1574623 RepID=A0ABD4T911_9CYAN|nr:hypothetical protein [Lyngbya confervoides]MCM1985096.1 hypothetical protein [Lyngbya confervoides BDU141951]